MDNKNLSVPLSIIVAGIIIAGAIYLTKSGSPSDIKANLSDTGGQQEESGGWPKEVSVNDHVLGNPDAPVKIIEFSDTECPFCQSLHPTLKKIMESYGKNGQVAWVYRHFPIDSRHPKARKEAEATECANELGGNQKFWEYLNRLFEITPANNGLEPSKLFEIAQYVNLDKKAFEECLSSGKHAQRVQSDFEDGLNVGVSGTPYSVIVAGDKKEVINGAPTNAYEIFKTTIEKLLR